MFHIKVLQKCPTEGKMKTSNKSFSIILNVHLHIYTVLHTEEGGREGTRSKIIIRETSSSLLIQEDRGHRNICDKDEATFLIDHYITSKVSSPPSHYAP